jgi:hypothetical protein
VDAAGQGGRTGETFAGKLHAVLCRNWKSRVKGRDFYELVWYVGRHVRVSFSL